MNRSIIRRVCSIVFICAACLFILLPLLRPGFPVTDDGDWMVIRLSAFYQSFREGQFPVRFLGRLNYSYGYPVANFLYPGFLYIGSFIHVLGFSFSSVVEIILGGSAIIGAIALFFWLRHFFDDLASSFGVVSFLFMPYLLYDMYKRGSVGEVLAVGLCLVALWLIEDKKRWILPPIIALLAISHNTLAVFFLISLFGYICLRRYWDVLIPFVLGVVMSAFFWLPAVFDQSLVIFNRVSVSNPAQYFAAGQQLIMNGIPFLIAGVLALVIGNRLYTKVRWYFFILLVGSAFLTTNLAAGIWKIPLLARVVQFPYRFLALWSFTGPWFIADIVDKKKNGIFWLLGLSAVIALIIFSLPYQKTQSILRPEGFYTTNEATTTVANEYMPKWVTTNPTARTTHRLELYKGNASIDEHRATSEIIDITVHAKEESVLQINTVYYPGWGAMIDGKPTVISYDNPSGLMRITIPTGDHSVYMAFRETAGRFIADILSIVAFVLYAGISIISETMRNHAHVNKRYT